MIYLLAILIAISGCSLKHKPAQPDSADQLDVLTEKYNGWLKDLTILQDKPTGWLSLTDCDGTLWQGEAVAAGHTGQLVLAEYPLGKIHRRPQVSGECYPKDSASTVSNDMLTGYVLGMYFTKDLDALKRLMAYNVAHNGIMGEPVDDTRVHYSPNGQGELARAIAKLGGDNSGYANVPETCLPVAEDYEYHLQTLSVFMSGDISGAVSTLCLDLLKDNAKRFPNDALIQAVAGVYTGEISSVTALLNGAGYECPSYVRPLPIYCTIHKAMAAKIILSRFPTKG